MLALITIFLFYFLKTGLDAVRVAYDGSPLPPVRLVSTVVHRDEGYHDHAVTLFLIAWGQAIDHDITLTGETKGKKKGLPIGASPSPLTRTFFSWKKVIAYRGIVW